MTRISTNTLLNMLVGNDELNIREDTNAIINALFDAENNAISVNVKGTLPSSVLPSISLSEVSVYADEAEMLAADTQEGDVAVRSDENKTYMHNDGSADTMADWTELQTPTDAVLSVNGETGAVTLTTGDLTEDADHKYVTDAEKIIIGNTLGVNTGDQDLSGLQDILNEGEFEDGDKTKLDGIEVGATADQDLSGLAEKSNVLELDNTNAFTPDANYEPATKKYVDDNAGGVEGTEYLYVAGDGTSTENATELQAAYDTASGMTPNGNALATDNRVRIIVGPGKYEFPNSSPFEMDTQYIDVVSLTGNADVFTYTVSADGNDTTRANIIVDASDVFIKGIDASTLIWVDDGLAYRINGAFTITDDLANLVCENCKGGKYSFGTVVEASGIFTNCTSGDKSFGYIDEASGTFENCIGGINSFGSNGAASGTFTNCTAGAHSFGGNNGTASGTFTDCTGGASSFGFSGTASGTFINCTAGQLSFGDWGVLTGQLYYCRLTDGTFQTPAGDGVIYHSVDGNGDIIGLSDYAEKSNVLELDNTDAFTPNANYEPATKKYVDDNAGGVEVTSLNGGLPESTYGILQALCDVGIIETPITGGDPSSF